MPNKPGVYRFVGTRRTPSKGFIVSLDTYVEVRKDLAFPELMVAQFGSSGLYPISRYQGEWTLVREKE